MPPLTRGDFIERHRQEGAVLYIALIMLVIMALIGVVGMQVTGMQERMAANYLAANVAFQNVEGVVRNTECGIEEFVNRTSPGVCTVIDPLDFGRCDDGFDPVAWGETQSFTAVPATNIRQIDECVEGEAPLDEGGPKDANPFPIYQITSYAADDEDNPTSSAVVDTVFKL
ncbi:PilX N-terminal domain-containing pilus assembly protein [Luteimonas sp. MJ250]|uniref:pilus assembly PilX family protein n=1 Tax=Luteimonas sp. MJ250 TaxID=3129236 RepID=UPI0031BAC3A9